MKRFLCVMLVFLISLSLASPVAAARNEFAPSVGYKDGLDIEDAVIIKPVPDGKPDDGKPDDGKPDDGKPGDGKPDDGKPGDGKPDDGKPDDDKHEYERHDVSGCLVITSVPQARNKSTDIRQESRDTLIEVYEALTTGTAALPVEDYMVVRELIDLSFLQTPCVESDHTHREDLKQEETTITVVLNLGIKPGAEVEVLTYVEGEWIPIVEVLNNNDGTITCTFAHEGPVAFCVAPDDTLTPPQTGDAMAADLTLWIVLLIASVAGMAALMVYRRKAAR